MVIDDQYQADLELAEKLLKFSRTLYEEGFDIFVECYEPSEIIHEIIIPVRESGKCLHIPFEQRCKMEMALLAQITEENNENHSWDGAEHLWEHGY